MKNLEVRLAYVLGVALPLLKGVIFALAIVCFVRAVIKAAERRPTPA